MNAQTITSKTFRRIRYKGRGWVFSASDFLDLGGRAAIDQALSRLTKTGDIRRVSHGLYDYPRKHSQLGTLSPDLPTALQAIARKTGYSLQPSGPQAANMLGLSDQVPAQSVYLTDGPSKQLNIGQRTIQFRQAKRFTGADQVSKVVFRALQYIGKDRVDGRIVRDLRSRLSLGDKKKLAKDVKYASSWMQPAISQISQAI